METTLADGAVTGRSGGAPADEAVETITLVGRAIGCPIDPSEVTRGMRADHAAGDHAGLGRRLRAASPRGRAPGSLDARLLAGLVALGDRRAVAIAEVAATGGKGDRASRYEGALRSAGLSARDARALANRVAALATDDAPSSAPETVATPVPVEAGPAPVEDDDACRSALAEVAGLRWTGRKLVAGTIAIGPAGDGVAFEPVEATITMDWPRGVVAPVVGSDAEAMARAGRHLRMLASRRVGSTSAVASETIARITSGVDATHLAEEVTAELGRACARPIAWDKLQGVLTLCVATAAGAATRRRAAAILRRSSGLSDYAALFPLARGMGRRLTLHVGPTNSGKTHGAMAELIAAESGAYLAPLRLLAAEGRDILRDRGVATTLRTGEEHLPVAGARHVSSTIEAVDMGRPVAVAVIDEAQMLLDKDRGWAWTQAAFGVPAGHVILAGSPDAEPLVRRIAETTGEELTVVRHERLTPLRGIPTLVREIRPGDAIIAFKRAAVMELREALGRSHDVATIYGNLSPEVRRAEARRFARGEATVLVATDAIGLGLNLPIRRVLFAALEKFDGREKRALTPGEIRQVAGRAGRHGLAEVGYAGVLHPSLGGAASDASPVIAALAAPPVAPTDDRLPVLPPWSALEAVARDLGTEDLGQVLSEVSRVIGDDPLIRAADVTEPVHLSALVADSGLPMRTRYVYTASPVSWQVPQMAQTLRRWARAHGAGERIWTPISLARQVAGSREELAKQEVDARIVVAYLWLALRWPETYHDAAGATEEGRRLNGLVEAALKRKGWVRSCQGCGARLHSVKPHKLCFPCSVETRTIIESARAAMAAETSSAA